ncbi:Transmembrane protein 64 [Sesamum angolense]|uniref:Transmembrane protein 64 n=1 Tax=Sesamum angolense TaxID=2727404 RepID=A0AAE2BWN0_9LAMI|nr:Transmembrane protein 64 [Sesamum angolense]
MTYIASEEDLKLERDYVKLEGGDGGDGYGGTLCQAETSPSCRGAGGGERWSLWWWTKLVLGAVVAGILGAVIFKWVGPFVIEKPSEAFSSLEQLSHRSLTNKLEIKHCPIGSSIGIVPIINWEIETFSRTKLALIIFGSLTIFPSFLLPSSPSMWVAGMSFGYVYGFLLIIGAVSIGVSVPYFIGSLFYHRIQVWLDKYPKKASVIRLAGEGSLFNQFRAVAFIRISPFPYIIYNYCAVATDVKYGPYLLGTLVGMVPEIFVTLYTGIFINTLANASSGRRSMSVPEIILNVGGFCLTAAATAVVTLYAKKRLKELKMKERLVLR